MDTPFAMQIFVEVVRHESFTRAARALNVSKSHVSKQIDRLEEHLGVRLLQRTTRQLSLTEAGNIYYQRCMQIIADIADAEQSVSRLHSLPTGTLKITAPMTFGVMYLNHMISTFLAQYPDLKADIYFSDQVVDLLDSGFDLAVRIGNLEDSSLTGRKLADIEILTVASPAYLKAFGTPTRPEHLRDHSCLFYSYQAAGTTWQFHHRDNLEASVQVQVQGRMSANNGQALTQASAAGLGVHIIPDFIAAEDIRAGRLTTILPEWKSKDMALWVVYPERRFLSQKVRLFVDFLAEQFGNSLPWAI